MVENDIDRALETANGHFESREYEKAFKAYADALGLLNKETRTSRNQKLWFDTYFGIVESLDKTSEWVKALQYAGTLISESKIQGKKRIEIRGRLIGSNILVQQGNWDEAKKRYQDAIKLVETSGSKEELAECYNGLAYIDWRKGDMRAAKAKAHKALDLVKDGGASMLLAKVTNLLGAINDGVGNADEAISYFKRTIEYYTELEPDGELARAHNNIGEVYKVMENYESAARHYEECTKVSKMVWSKRGELYGLSNLAECNAFLGHAKEARKQVAEVEKLLSTVKDKYIMAQIHHTKGLVAVAESDLNTAITEFSTSIEKLKRIGTPPYDVGISYFRLGKTYSNMGEKEKANDAFNKAKVHLQKAGAQQYLNKLKKQQEPED